MATRFPREWVDEVRDRSDIVALVAEYVPLKRNGHRHWGLCPFHGEKTASFSVDAEKQMYYCFGCHVGGNVFHFVMAVEHMEFPEAVRHLAERAHMDIPDQVTAQEAPKKDKERLLAALTEAARFYNRTLHTKQGEQALAYLHERGLSDATIRKFGLGSTAVGWDKLHTHLTEMGFLQAELVDANLVLERGGKVFDAFRDRVMFPIFDPVGRVIAFGGRVIGDGQPKYLNSSDTYVFNKRRNCYGLNFLKGKQSTQLRLVEGYMDVVSLYQHGIEGCVATLGTALTPEQIRLMKRYAPQILICYDGDGAGQRATLRALELFEQENIVARVCVVPDEKDPDDYVRQLGGQALLAIESLEATTYRLNSLVQARDMTREEERTAYAVDAANVLRKLENPVEVERFIKRLTIETGFAEDVLRAQVGIVVTKTKNKDDARNKANRVGKDNAETQFVKAQKGLLSFIAAGERIPTDGLMEADFTHPSCVFMAKHLFAGGMRALNGALDTLEDENLRAQIAQILLIDAQCTADNKPRMIAQYLNRLRTDRLEKQHAQLMAQVDAPDLSQANKMEMLMRLQEMARQLDAMNKGLSE